MSFQASLQSISGYLKAALGLALLVFLFKRHIIKPEIIANGFSHPEVLLLALVVMTLGVNIAVYRWQILLKLHQTKSSFLRVQSITYIALFTGSFLPTSIGTDIIKVYYACGEEPNSAASVTASVILDRLIGLYTLLITLLALIIVDYPDLNHHQILRLIALSLALLLGAIPISALVLLHTAEKLSKNELKLFNKFSRKFNLLPDMIQSYTLDLPTLALTLFLGLLGHACTLTSIVIIAIEVNPPLLNWYQYSIAGGISIFSNILPITIGGLGVGESVFDQTCKLLSNSPGYLGYGSSMFLWRALSLIATMPGAIALTSFRRCSGHKTSESP